MEWDTPQKRLRAHQYHQPALAKWRVFEIAAILPMLLQVSLGLFFIGLCFFTASVDERMGRTSMPLVSGWAFFLVFTTLSPLFSPRCPYKIPLLKTIMQAIRHRLVTPLRRALVDVIIRRFVRQPSGPLSSGQDQEEVDVVTGTENDADILVSTDAIMASDIHLLTLWDAFKQSSQDPLQSLSFILCLVANRLGQPGKNIQPLTIRRIPDLSLLSRRAWDAFMEMFAELARRQAGPLLVSSPDWLHNITLLLLSFSPYPLPASGVSNLMSLLHAQPGVDPLWDQTRSIATWIAPHSEDSDFVFHPLAPRLLPVYTTVGLQSRPSLLMVLQTYQEFLRPYFKHIPGSQSMRLVLFRESDLFQHGRVRPVLIDMWDVLHACVIAENRQNYGTLRHGLMEGLVLLLEFAAQMDREADAVGALTTFWGRSELNAHVALCLGFVALHERSRSSGIQMLQLITDAFLKSEGMLRADYTHWPALMLMNPS